MFIDTRNPRAVHPSQCDICIVGAGAAGITLARQLAGQRQQIILLESGGIEFEERTQALSRGMATGTLLSESSDYLEKSRLRYFGGSTNHWGGYCRPLDASDFDAREWVPHSGWPISWTALEPYYAAACSLCGVAPFTLTDEAPVLPGWQTFCRALFQQAPPIRFGVAYRRDIEVASNITTLLGAHALRLEYDATGTRVTAALVKTGAGREERIRAETFVLAAGGLENPRLLLLSEHRSGAGKPPTSEAIGRFFMDHPHAPLGKIVFFESSGRWQEYVEARYASGRMPVRDVAAFRLTAESQRRLRTLNVSMTLIRVPQPLEATSDGLLRYWRALTAAIAPDPVFPQLDTSAYQTLRAQYARTISTTATLMDLWRSTGIINDRTVGPEASNSVQAILFARAEQAPNPDSRVSLGEALDPNGQPELKLDWRLADIDRDSLMTAGQQFASELGRQNLGRMELLFPQEGWPLAGGGCHHIGTTRMSADARTGVVDTNCRVHGVANLYVAGSSVFPTSGCSNPTLTLVALALRLAEHLRRRSS